MKIGHAVRVDLSIPQKQLRNLKMELIVSINLKSSASRGSPASPYKSWTCSQPTPNQYHATSAGSRKRDDTQVLLEIFRHTNKMPLFSYNTLACRQLTLYGDLENSARSSEMARMISITLEK